jgi:hypothetical protein
MTWEQPSFQEVSMNSEIGAYQEDFEQREPGDMPRRNASADGVNLSGPGDTASGR